MNTIEFIIMIVDAVYRVLTAQAGASGFLAKAIWMVLYCTVMYSLMKTVFLYIYLSSENLMAYCTSKAGSWLLQKLQTVVQEEEVPPETPVVVYPHQFLMGKMGSFLPSINYEAAVVYAIYCISTVAFIISLKLLTRVIWRTVLKVSYSVRGINDIVLEAKIPGSHFFVGEKPDFQFRIYDYGNFSSTFVGYGVRVGNTAIIPKHVIQAVRSKVVIENQGAVAALGVTPRQSAVFPDIYYYVLPDSMWTNLRITTARVPKKLDHNVLVMCYGEEGQSSGMLLHHATVAGLMEYHGSTIPGMSGSAYYSGNMLYGVHTGTSGSQTNIGASSLMMSIELARIIKGETPTRSDLHGLVDTPTKVKAAWNLDSFRQRVDYAMDVDTTSIWDADVDYDADLMFESNPKDTKEKGMLAAIQFFSTLDSANKDSFIQIMKTRADEARLVNGHAPDKPLVDTGKDFVSVRLEWTEEHIKKLSYRTTELEEEATEQARVIKDLEIQFARVSSQLADMTKKVQPKGKAPPLLRVHRCAFPGCGFGSKIEAGLAAHVWAKKHNIMPTEVVKETAYSSDVNTTIKMDKAPVFRTVKTNLIPRPLLLQGTQNQSSSPQESQSPTIESQQVLLKIFEVLQQHMGGQNLDTQRK